jgi:D-3-phosphoglycerate dehydrogenase
MLETAGEVRSGPFGRAELIDAVKDADALIVRLGHRADRALVEAAPRLRIIATATTGLDHVDLEAARSRGIKVVSLRGESAFLETVRATSEHTWAILLALFRVIPAAVTHVLDGGWDRDRFKGHELAGRRLGILGLGRIGSAVAEFGKAFQMRVRAFDPYRATWPGEVESVDSLRALLESSDVLSIHVPLTDETRGMLGGRELAWLPEGAVIVNTARGAVVDEVALLEALKGGKLAGAALDVLADEPALQRGVTNRPLLEYARTRNNLIVTPHIGGATHESMEKTEIFIAEKLVRHLRDEGDR